MPSSEDDRTQEQIEKGHMKLKVDFKVMQLQAKERGLSEATRSGEEARMDSFLEPPERVWPCRHLDFKLESKFP